MIPAGYMSKVVARKPDSIAAAQVRDLYSVSSCISANFADYVGYWKHNRFWFFDSADVIQGLCAEHGIDLANTTLFFYEIHEHEYDSGQWKQIPVGATLASPSLASPSPADLPATDIEPPQVKRLVGFDVVCYSTGNSPECSPLSCNALANDVSVNEHCLFETFNHAKEALEQGRFENSEPGPYRILAVYRVDS